MSNSEKLVTEKKFEKASKAANEMVLEASKPRVSSFKRVLVTLGLFPGQVKTPSSSIAHVRYKRSEHTLDVTFQNGSAYRYFDVSPETVKELLAAPSIGRQFNAHLRNDFRYQLIRGRLKPSVAEQKKASIVKSQSKGKKAAIAA
jgi:hypothetical protein